jgi:hypothetical protein
MRAISGPPLTEGHNGAPEQAGALYDHWAGTAVRVSGRQGHHAPPPPTSDATSGVNSLCRVSGTEPRSCIVQRGYRDTLLRPFGEHLNVTVALACLPSIMFVSRRLKRTNTMSTKPNNSAKTCNTPYSYSTNPAYLCSSCYLVAGYVTGTQTTRLSTTQ